jgi:hypothetical protein
MLVEEWLKELSTLRQAHSVLDYSAKFPV